MAPTCPHDISVFWSGAGCSARSYFSVHIYHESLRVDWAGSLDKGLAFGGFNGWARKIMGYSALEVEYGSIWVKVACEREPVSTATEVLQDWKSCTIPQGSTAQIHGNDLLDFTLWVT